MSLDNLGLVAFIVVIYLSSRNWQRSLLAVFILVVAEGALRKWALPQLSDLLYFLKDVILLGAYLRYFILSGRPRHYQKFQIIEFFLISSVGWCAYQVFNPSLGSPIAGLFGLRGYLFYIPLISLTSELFKSEEELYRTLRYYLLLVIPVGLLGILQFFSPPSSPLNVYAGGTDPTAGFAGTEYIRITGTFPYISGFTVYLSVCFAVLIPILLRPKPRWWQWVVSVEMVLIVTNSLMTGSRSVILFEVLYLLGYISLSIVRNISQIEPIIKQFILPSLASVYFLANWVRPAFEAFSTRATSSDNLNDRVGDTLSFIPFFQYKGLDGYGVGATHQAVSTLRNVLGLPRGEVIPVGFESEFGRIALEIGPIGFFLWYGLRLALLIELFRLFWRLQHQALQNLALAAFLTHLIQFTGQLVVHNVFSIYYWSLTGFIFLLPLLEKSKYFESGHN